MSLSGAFPLLQPFSHFVIFYKLSPVGLRDAFAYSSAIFHILRHKPQGQMFGVCSGVGGDLRKLLELLGGEMHFHKRQGQRRPAL